MKSWCYVSVRCTSFYQELIIVVLLLLLQVFLIMDAILKLWPKQLQPRRLLNVKTSSLITNASTIYQSLCLIMRSEMYVMCFVRVSLLVIYTQLVVPVFVFALGFKAVYQQFTWKCGQGILIFVAYNIHDMFHWNIRHFRCVYLEDA